MRKYNIIETYIDEDEPWLCILEVPEFTICSAANRLKFYSTGELVFGPDMNIPIKLMADW